MLTFFPHNNVLVSHNLRLYLSHNCDLPKPCFCLFFFLYGGSGLPYCVDQKCKNYILLYITWWHDFWWLSHDADWNILRWMLCASCHFPFFFSQHTKPASVHMRHAETTGWCLTQASTSKWNLLFSFYAKCLRGYGWKWNYVYCFPIVPQSTESAGVGFWPLAKTEKSFIFFLHWLSNSDVEMKFWSNMA